MPDTDISGYGYSHSSLNHSHEYLLPAVLSILDKLNLAVPERRLFELGCGNGSVANELSRRGWDITGVDPSTDGIRQAKRGYPELKLANGSAYEDLGSQYGQFPVVLSLEVVEHVYAPRHYSRTVFSLLEGGSHYIDSLPRLLLEEPRAGIDRPNG